MIICYDHWIIIIWIIIFIIFIYFIYLIVRKFLSPSRILFMLFIINGNALPPLTHTHTSMQTYASSTYTFVEIKGGRWWLLWRNTNENTLILIKLKNLLLLKYVNNYIVNFNHFIIGIALHSSAKKHWGNRESQSRARNGFGRQGET